MKIQRTKKPLNKIHDAILLAVLTLPSVGFGREVEDILRNVQSRVVTTFIPLIGILGLMYAGVSYILGHANARNRLVWAIIGAFIGFGAPAIIQLIQQVAR